MIMIHHFFSSVQQIKRFCIERKWSFGVSLIGEEDED
jgi:hypothetical protein